MREFPVELTSSVPEGTGPAGVGRCRAAAPVPPGGASRPSPARSLRRTPTIEDRP